MEFVDAHCHLEHSAFDSSLECVVTRMREKNVLAVNTGRVLEANEKVLEQCKSFPKALFPVIGLSPHDASSADLDKEIEFVEKHGEEIVGVGEVGLDFHYFKEKNARARQVEVFKTFLELAERLRKPVVIHSRDAEEEVLELLEGFSGVKVMHCFMQSQFVERVLEADCFVSVPTLKNSSVVKVIERVPLEKLLCETDSPFLWKGGNEPVNVVSVYEEVAVIKKLDLDVAVKQIRVNVERVYGF